MENKELEDFLNPPHLPINLTIAETGEKVQIPVDFVLDMGNKAASLTGGVCERYYVDGETKEVVFCCKEFNERFILSMKAIDLYHDYLRVKDL